MKLSKGALLFGVAFTIFSFLSTPSIACSSTTGNLTLEQKCWTDLFQVRPVALSEAIAFDLLLLRQGYENTLVLHPSTRSQGLSYSISPSLGRDQNINGGNPDKPLVLNGLTFVGQEELQAESGWLVGLNAGMSLSQPIAEGTYITSALQLYYGAHAGSNLRVGRYSLNTCANTQLSQAWYAGSCIAQSGTKRDLSSSRVQSISLEAGHVASLTNVTQAAVGVQLERVLTYDYAQNRYGFDLDVIHNFMPSTYVQVQKGQDVQGEHVLDFNLTVRQQIRLGRHGYGLSISRSVYNGSRLLGVAREDVIEALTVSTFLPDLGSINFGYSRTDSTIDYYDLDSPTFSVGFEALF
jgi:hypothetical protein